MSQMPVVMKLRASQVEVFGWFFVRNVMIALNAVKKIIRRISHFLLNYTHEEMLQFRNGEAIVKEIPGGYVNSSNNS